MDYIIINSKKILTKVAVTEEEQKKGLMFEKNPSIMVFPYNKPGIKKFWMKNTPLPLDIAFCKNNFVIDILKGEPLSTNLIGPDEECDMVVEFPYGSSSIFGLEKGSNIQFVPSMKTIAKIILN